MRTISIKPQPYILESDRDSAKVEEQTVFWIKPRTVRDGTDVAEAYGKAIKENKKKMRTEIDTRAFNDADDEQWLKHIIKIENAFIDPEESPDGAYDIILLKIEKEPNNYKKLDDGTIHVITTEDDDVRLAIFHAMPPNDAEEVVKVVSEYSQLRRGSKNY